MNKQARAFDAYSVYLFDFAEVLTYPQDRGAFLDMSSVAGVGEEEFSAAYWAHRRPYDLGQPGAEYWKTVAGRSLSTEEVRRLIDLDCRSWFRLNPGTIGLLDELKRRRKRLALLSNLPIDLVARLRFTEKFFPVFEQVFFSAELGLAKPDPEVYAYVLDKLGVAGAEVLFFDDRQVNLDGARALGLDTFLFFPESGRELLELL